MATKLEIVEIWLHEVLEGLPVNIVTYGSAAAITDIDVQLKKTDYIDQNFVRFVPLSIYLLRDGVYYRLTDKTGLMNPKSYMLEANKFNMGDPALIDKLAKKFRNHVEKFVGRN